MTHYSQTVRATVRAGFAAAALIAAGLLTASPASAQSLSYTSGQNVSPAFEGWQVRDGVKFFVFGYMNRNWEEELDVPVGPNNGFSGATPDVGQPTHFLPRRNRFVFEVPVPTGFTEKDELVWTLTTAGKTEKAYASLRLDYEIDDVVRASETGALGAGSSSPEVRGNKAPKVTVQGTRTLTAKVGVPLRITTLVTDDGVPKARGAGLAGAAVANPGATQRATDALPATNPAAPRRNLALLPPTRITVGKNVGLHLSWYVYRGAGAVTFSPSQVKPWEDTRAGANSPWAPIWVADPMPADGKIDVAVTFAAPGNYQLRGVADDGALTGWDDVVVSVTR